MAIELLDGSIELCALLALDEKLGDLSASLHVFRAYLSDLPLLGRALTLAVQGPKRVFRPLALVLVERDLGLCVPDLPFLVRERLPGEPDDLGERAVVCLDLRGDVLVFDEGGSEEDERVRGARDVILWLLLRMTVAPIP